MPTPFTPPVVCCVSVSSEDSSSLRLRWPRVGRNPNGEHGYVAHDLPMKNGEWRFPEIGLPPVISHLWMGFSIVNQPKLGNIEKKWEKIVNIGEK